MKILYILILKGIELDKKKMRTPQLLSEWVSLKALLYTLEVLKTYVQIKEWETVYIFCDEVKSTLKLIWS